MIGCSLFSSVLLVQQQEHHWCLLNQFGNPIVWQILHVGIIIISNTEKVTNVKTNDTADGLAMRRASCDRVCQGLYGLFYLLKDIKMYLARTFVFLF